jgi:hypothetical protein
MTGFYWNIKKTSSNNGNIQRTLQELTFNIDVDESEDENNQNDG